MEADDRSVTREDNNGSGASSVELSALTDVPEKNKEEMSVEKDTDTSFIDIGEKNDGTSDGKEDIDMESADSSVKTDKEQDANDPYGYTKRDEFTSEVFKIEINNLPRFGYRELKKRLAKLDIKPVKIKSIPRATFAFVTFRDEKEREEAMNKINGHLWRNNTLVAKKAKAAPDPMLKKRKAEGNLEGEPADKKGSVCEDEDKDLPPEIRIKKAVTSLWEMSYEEQLKVKTVENEQVMKKFADLIHCNNPAMRPWLAEQRSKFDGHCCSVEPIISSPVQEAYRNKCEFTIGLDVKGNDNTVGFRFGQYKDGTSAVGEPYGVTNLPQAMKTVVKCFQEFLRDGEYPAYNPETHEGYWRMLTVRTTLHDIMVIADLHPQLLPTDVVYQERVRLRDYFSVGKGKSCGVTSLYIRVYKNRMTGSTTEPFIHISGKRSIQETLLGMKFEISPEAFFQVNTAAAEVLYTKIGEWCEVTPNTTILDVCCGTGTIGLTLAKKVFKVIGVEMNQQAIDNAWKNAELNGITNVTYYCEKAEDVMTKTMRGIRSDNVIAIVDPPRGGLHGQVIKALRSSPYLKRIIYVSCNPKGALPNFLDIIRPSSKKMKGEPFKPVKAVPLDMFPQTKHCELVILFEREFAYPNKPKNTRKSDDSSDDDDSSWRPTSLPPIPGAPELHVVEEPF